MKIDSHLWVVFRAYEGGFAPVGMNSRWLFMFSLLGHLRRFIFESTLRWANPAPQLKSP